jgi:TolB protein
MKRIWRDTIRYLVVLGVCLIAVTPHAAAQSGYEYIDISNPFLRKIPIAVPWFKALTGNAAEKQAARDVADMLSETLVFTGYFKLLDRGAFLIDPDNPNILTPQIQFRNWTGIGAELLITGQITLTGNVTQMELRLFDVFKERLVVGKRYKGWVEDQRRMVRRFAAEVLFALTGSRGYFDSSIAFISNGSGHKEIFLCEYDGRRTRQFTHHKSITLFPAWSSDGKWMAYTSYKNGKPDLFIRNIKEKRGSIVAKSGIHITPAWIPGKFELAATLSYNGDQEIYLLTGGGKVIKRLTNTKGIDVEPTLSPDGRKMAFVSNRSGSPQIYVKDLNSGRVERLTFQGRYNTSPSWSPSGDKIAYAAMEQGEINIYVVDIASKEPVRLTENQGSNEAPSWSPDGSMIVFSSSREGPSRIYVMSAFGTDQRRLLVLPGEQSNPRWSPNANIN